MTFETRTSKTVDRTGTGKYNKTQTNASRSQSTLFVGSTEGNDVELKKTTPSLTSAARKWPPNNVTSDSCSVENNGLSARLSFFRSVNPSSFVSLNWAQEQEQEDHRLSRKRQWWSRREPNGYALFDAKLIAGCWNDWISKKIQWKWNPRFNCIAVEFVTEKVAC